MAGVGRKGGHERRRKKKTEKEGRRVEDERRGIPPRMKILDTAELVNKQLDRCHWKWYHLIDRMSSYWFSTTIMELPCIICKV